MCVCVCVCAWWGGGARGGGERVKVLLFTVDQSSPLGPTIILNTKTHNKKFGSLTQSRENNKIKMTMMKQRLVLRTLQTELK